MNIDLSPLGSISALLCCVQLVKKKKICCLRLYDITLLTATIAKCKSVCGVVCDGGSPAS